MTIGERFDAENRRRLEQCRDSASAGDRSSANALLDELHWFAHDDAEVHVAVHRLEWQLAREAGDARAAIRSVLPNVFAGAIARLERLGPSYHAEARIEAPRAVVYEVIADVARYAEWNPWLRSAIGGSSPGESVVADVVLGSGTQKADHEIAVAVPGERFAWRDRGWFTALAHGQRLRILIEEDGATRLLVRLSVTGPFAYLVHLLYGRALAKGLGEETTAIARRAEALTKETRRG